MAVETATTTTATTTRKVTPSELAKHNSKKSCYIAVNNKVYDVTAFLSDHPGGEDLILDHAGKDVTEIMKDEVSHFHSEAAYEILDGDYFVGQLVSENSQLNGQMSFATAISNGTANGVVRTKTGMTKEEDLSVPTDITVDYKTHKFIDLNKPMLMQVWNSGWSKEFYLEQVHRPRHYKGGESAPLFGNFLEPLSKTPWYVVPMVWLPCVAYGTYLASQGVATKLVPVLFLTGLCTWSLVEYFLHRCLFHIDDLMPDHRISITLHFLLHGIHHYLPMDKLRLVMPPVLFLVLALPWWKFAHTIIPNWHAATNVYCGGIFGYICYDLTHYFLHHKNLPSYYKELKKYHLQHHFADYQNGFGVTSRFWDRVFGTELVYGQGTKAA